MLLRRNNCLIIYYSKTVHVDIFYPLFRNFSESAVCDLAIKHREYYRVSVTGDAVGQAISPHSFIETSITNFDSFLCSSPFFVAYSNFFAIGHCAFFMPRHCVLQERSPCNWKGLGLHPNKTRESLNFKIRVYDFSTNRFCLIISIFC